MNPLDLVPGPLKVYASIAAVVAVAAAVAGAALWHHHVKWAALDDADAGGYARGHAELVAYKAKVDASALLEAQKRHQVEIDLAGAQQENANEAQRLGAADRARNLASSGRADAAGQRLQHDVDAAAATARGGGLPGDPAAAAERAAAVTALQNLVGACRRAIQQLGRDDDDTIADGRQRHGECIADYEAVRRQSLRSAAQ